jgi:hypothetical protein
MDWDVETNMKVLLTLSSPIVIKRLATKNTDSQKIFLLMVCTKQPCYHWRSTSNPDCLKFSNCLVCAACLNCFDDWSDAGCFGCDPHGLDQTDQTDQIYQITYCDNDENLKNLDALEIEDD